MTGLLAAYEIQSVPMVFDVRFLGDFVRNWLFDLTLGSEDFPAPLSFPGIRRGEILREL